MKPLNLPWREPAREAGPITLNARRLYILPTRTGLTFGLLLLALLMVAINYGIALGYLFVFLLASVGVVGLFHSQRNLLGLRLIPEAVAPVFAGERARFRMSLSAPGKRTRHACVLLHPEAIAPPFDVPAEGLADTVLELSQPRRGLHRPGRLTLASTWPLGLFRCWTVFALDWNVLVYPAPAGSSLPIPERGDQGAAGGNHGSGDDEFALLRAYRPGDAPSRIAWKSVARGQAPLTRQFAGSAGSELTLDWLDCPETDPEARLSRLTRWALDAERSGRPWRLVLPDWSQPAGRGEHHLAEALSALAHHA